MAHCTKMTFVRWALTVCRIIAPMSDISIIIFGIIIRLSMFFLSLTLLPAYTLLSISPLSDIYSPLNMLFLMLCYLQMRHV